MKKRTQEDGKSNRKSKDSNNRTHDQERRVILGKVDRLGTGEKSKAGRRGNMKQKNFGKKQEN